MKRKFKAKSRKSMFGIDKGMKPFTEKDELDFVGLEKKKVPKTIFGSLKGKAKPPT